MKCSKCGNECNAKAETRLGDLLVGDCKAVSMCCSAEIVDNYPEDMNVTHGTPRTGIKENNMDWKDLEIGDIPEFVENKVEIKVRDIQDIPGSFKPLKDFTKSVVVKNLIDGTWAYQWKIKPLKSIRIDKGLNDIIIHYITNTPGSFPKYSFCDGVLKMTDNRKVEIIGDE